MAIDERQRHLLHEKLDDVLGPDQAATLMEHLPPVGWADVARRSDVDHLGEMLRLEFRGGIDGLRAEMHREFGEVRKENGSNHRQLVLAIIASQFTAVSLAFAAMSLAG